MSEVPVINASSQRKSSSLNLDPQTTPETEQIRAFPVTSSTSNYRKWAILALMITTVAGAVILALGCIHQFGAVGSVGHISSISVGAAVGLSSIIGICFLIYQNKKIVAYSSSHSNIETTAESVPQKPKEIVYSRKELNQILIRDVVSKSTSEVEKLIAKGADVHAKNTDGATALHLAAGYGEYAVVVILVNANAKVDALDKEKNTPLHYAASHGRLETIQFLINKNAKIDLENVNGQTPLLLAQTQLKNEHPHRQAIIDLLTPK